MEPTTRTRTSDFALDKFVTYGSTPITPRKTTNIFTPSWRLVDEASGLEEGETNSSDEDTSDEYYARLHKEYVLAFENTIHHLKVEDPNATSSPSQRRKSAIRKTSGHWRQTPTESSLDVVNVVHGDSSLPSTPTMERKPPSLLNQHLSTAESSQQEPCDLTKDLDKSSPNRSTSESNANSLQDTSRQETSATALS